MRGSFELHDSRIDQVELSDSVARVHFPHAYIFQSKGQRGRHSGTGWSHEALLVIYSAEITTELPPLPATVSEGYLQVGATQHTALPVPFKRKADVRLSLVLNDGTAVNIAGRGAVVELLGQPIRLEDL